MGEGADPRAELRSVPQDVDDLDGLLGEGTELSEQYLQIRINGDLALFQALGRRLLEAPVDRRIYVLAQSRSREPEGQRQPDEPLLGSVV